MGNHLPMDNPPPVCPRMFGYTAKDPSIHYFKMPLPSALKINGSDFVPLRYFIIWVNLPQSSLSGSLTLVVRKEIAVQVSGQRIMSSPQYCEIPQSFPMEASHCPR